MEKFTLKNHPFFDSVAKIKELNEELQDDNSNETLKPFTYNINTKSNNNNEDEEMDSMNNNILIIAYYFPKRKVETLPKSITNEKFLFVYWVNRMLVDANAQIRLEY